MRAIARVYTERLRREGDQHDPIRSRPRSTAQHVWVRSTAQHVWVTGYWSRGWPKVVPQRALVSYSMPQLSVLCGGAVDLNNRKVDQARLHVAARGAELRGRPATASVCRTVTLPAAPRVRLTPSGRPWPLRRALAALVPRHCAVARQCQRRFVTVARSVTRRGLPLELSGRAESESLPLSGQPVPQFPLAARGPRARVSSDLGNAERGSGLPIDPTASY